VSETTLSAPSGEQGYVIDVQVDPPYADRVSVDALVEVAERVLRRAGQPPGTTLTVVITDDDAICALNRNYRDEDSTTDVLSFAATGGETFVTPDDEPPYLGDVMISFPTALAQSNARGEAVGDELRLLVAHGCLHLLGYDHATPEEEAAMWTLQDEALAG
jgi:probable rRNA maturation factor